jgi:hypothetical protein
MPHSCSGPYPGSISWLLCPSCLSYSACPILSCTVLSCQSCPDSPSCCPILVVLAWLPCADCPSWLSGPDCSAVLFWLSCPSFPASTVLFWMSCSGCSVPAGLFWPGSVPMVLGYMYCIKRIINPKLFKIRTIEMSLYSVGCL